MSKFRNQVPLEAVLQQAGLISAEQVNHALERQKQIQSNLTVAQILAFEGKIDPKTADFFAARWSNLAVEKPKQPIGQYLKQASLLNEQQIETILDEQQRSNRKFGELAIAKGWIKQTTLNFFLSQFQGVDPAAAVEQQTETFEPSGVDLTVEPDYSQKVHEGFLKIKRKLLKVEGQNIYSEKILDRVLFWTNGNSFLTQKLFSLIAQNIKLISPQQEEEQIDYLVQSKIIDDWSNNELKLHLQSISDRLLHNQQCSAARLLQLYQRILTETVSVTDNQEQQELLSSGIIVRQQNKLTVSNRIYRSVFNLNWVGEALSQLNKAALGISTPDNSRLVAPAASDSRETKDSWFKLKNIVLLLTLLGLLGIFINNIVKRITVRTAFQQGNELLKQKFYRQSIDQYNKLLKIDSNYFQAWTNRGYALAGLEKYDAMQESCSAATIIDPTAIYAWNCQGEALHNLQRYKEAIAAFDQAIALNQDDPIFLINKSESLTALGRDQESTDSINQAIQVLEQIESVAGAEKISGEFAVALTFLGNSHRQQQDYTQAIAAYNRALNYAPQYFPARIGKGITLSRAQRHPAAREQFEEMLQDIQLTEGQQAQTWFYLGKTLCKSQQNTEGGAAFARAIELNPEYDTAKKARQQCLLNQ
ncbi:MAG: tetratricopeptide repeat protein [Cyanobacteria bacterium P01_C01_bin.72]